MVAFAPLNLATDPYPGALDGDRLPQRPDVLHRRGAPRRRRPARRALAPGGWLALSPLDSTPELEAEPARGRRGHAACRLLRRRAPPLAPSPARRRPRSGCVPAAPPAASRALRARPRRGRPGRLRRGRRALPARPCATTRWTPRPSADGRRRGGARRPRRPRSRPSAGRSTPSPTRRRRTSGSAPCCCASGAPAAARRSLATAAKLFGAEAPGRCRGEGSPPDACSRPGAPVEPARESAARLGPGARAAGGGRARARRASGHRQQERAVLGASAAPARRAADDAGGPASGSEFVGFTVVRRALRGGRGVRARGDGAGRATPVPGTPASLLGVVNLGGACVG